MKAENKFFMILFLAVLLLSFLTIRTLINALLTAAVLVYIFYPLYNWLKNKVKSESVAAFTITLILLLLMIVPAAFLVKELTGELFQVYFGVKKIVSIIESPECTAGSLICSLTSLYKTISSDPQLRMPLANLFSKLTVYLIETVSNLLLNLPEMVVELFIIFFSMYYLFKDGKSIVQRLESLAPLKEEHKANLFSKIETSIRSTVYGSLIIAVVQGLLATAGFYFLGAPQPILLGLLTVFAAILPLAGAAIIWLPTSLIIIVNSMMQQDNLMLFKGVALFAYGTFVVSGIDNILKPKLIGRAAGIHPLLVFLGVIGGLKLFGFAGFLIGPTILVVLITIIDIYSKERGLK